MKALLLRDLQLATRAGGGFGLGLAFFLIVCTLVPFGVGAGGDILSRIAPGIMWVGALLACLLSLDRIFALDGEDGSLDLLATAPLPLEGVVLAKAAAHWVTTGLPLVVAAPLFGLLLHLHRLLFVHTETPGGTFKDDDNLVVDRSPDGTVEVRFVPVPAARTEAQSTLPCHFEMSMPWIGWSLALATPGCGLASPFVG